MGFVTSCFTYAERPWNHENHKGKVLFNHCSSSTASWKQKRTTNLLCNSHSVFSCIQQSVCIYSQTQLCRSYSAQRPIKVDQSPWVVGWTNPSQQRVTIWPFFYRVHGTLSCRNRPVQLFPITGWGSEVHLFLAAKSRTVWGTFQRGSFKVSLTDES